MAAITVSTATVTPVDRVNISLDIVRGLAALAVLLGHARGAVFHSHGIALTGTGWQRLALLPTGFGEEAVAVFFVLSGYLVGGQVLRSNRRGTFSWRIYLAKRLSRLWTVLLPGLVLTIGLGAIASRNFAVQYSVLRPHDGSRNGLGDAVCNLLFLNPSRCVGVGPNDPLWTLGYEFWFYILFAGVLAAAAGGLRKQWVSAAIAATVAVASVMIFGWGLLQLIPAWLLGVVIAELGPRLRGDGRSPDARSYRFMILMATVIAVVVAVASNFWQPADWLKFIMVGIGVSPLILLLTLRPVSQRDARIGGRLGHWLGAWSYSLYVFHFPIVVLLTCAVADLPVASRMAQVGAVYALAIVAGAIAYPLSLITERHTDRVRDLLLRRGN